MTRKLWCYQQSSATKEYADNPDFELDHHCGPNQLWGIESIISEEVEIFMPTKGKLMKNFLDREFSEFVDAMKAKGQHRLQS